jgi:hypothetical protein
MKLGLPEFGHSAVEPNLNATTTPSLLARPLVGGFIVYAIDGPATRPRPMRVAMMELIASHAYVFRGLSEQLRNRRSTTMTKAQPRQSSAPLVLRSQASATTV